LHIAAVALLSTYCTGGDPTSVLWTNPILHEMVDLLPQPCDSCLERNDPAVPDRNLLLECNLLLYELVDPILKVDTI
jgi:hypothetical protein